MDQFQEAQALEFQKLRTYLDKIQDTSALNIPSNIDDSMEANANEVHPLFNEVIELAYSLISKAQGYVQLIADQHAQLEELNADLEDKDRTHQHDLDFQKQIAHQWQKLYQEQLGKNQQLQEQLKSFDDKDRGSSKSLTMSDFSDKFNTMSESAFSPSQSQKTCTHSQCRRRRQTLRETVQSQRQEIDLLNKQIEEFQSMIQKYEEDLELKEQQLHSLKTERWPSNRMTVAIEDKNSPNGADNDTEVPEDHINQDNPTPRHGGLGAGIHIKVDIPRYSIHGTPRGKVGKISFTSPSPRDQTILFKATKASAQYDPYQDFFNLICQSAKLNSIKFTKVINVETGHLYNEVIQKKISFNEWYKYVKDFIESEK